MEHLYQNFRPRGKRTNFYLFGRPSDPRSGPRPYPVMILFVTAFLLGFALLIPEAYSGQVTLQWDPPLDQSSAGYRLYYGVSSRSYSSSLDVGKNTAFTLSDLEEGRDYFFAVTSYDTWGNESAFSNEVVYQPPVQCSYSIYLTNDYFGYWGGWGTVWVSTQPGCTWTATSSAPWLSILSANIFSGESILLFSLSSNTSQGTRSAALTVAGRVFTIYQETFPSQ